MKGSVNTSRLSLPRSLADSFRQKAKELGISQDVFFALLLNRHEATQDADSIEKIKLSELDFTTVQNDLKSEAKVIPKIQELFGNR